MSSRNIRVFETEIAGSVLKAEIGRMATLSSGSVLLTYGETVILASAVQSKKEREGADFFPLSVDYQEKMYAVGKIPGGFLKREGRASEKAILSSRLIDRPIRPLFPDNYFRDVQLICDVLSVDKDHEPDTLAMIGASIALSISDIPFQGPIAGVHVAYVDGEYIINPNHEKSKESKLDLIVAGTKDAINMVEAGCDILSEEIMLGALRYGHQEIQKICDFISKIQDEIGKEKIVVEEKLVNQDLRNKVFENFEKMDEAIRLKDKVERNDRISELKEEIIMKFESEDKDEFEEQKSDISTYLGELEKETFRKMILEENIRPDGRAPDEIRDISAEVSILPRTHGSGLFTRGLTQALSITTLGALAEAQRIDGLGDDEDKTYMHHYNFPPFSVGETGFMRGPNRRAIGHGALGERALIPVLPNREDFPYAIRVVSEVLTCNGSSSQASICGSSLSLMDAGVPIKGTVAGIAMGLIGEGDNIKILSDIQGMEDFMGDMDFKVAGTRDGITAMQMDIKIKGLKDEILVKAMEQARLGRIHIIDKMEETINVAKDDMSKYAPRVFTIKIHPDKIREVIGTGGKVINGIIDETGVKMDIEDDGLVLITAPDSESGNMAKKMVEAIVKEVEPGEIFDGKVVRLMKFGVFVSIGGGKEGLCHISQLDKRRVEKVEDVVSVGDEIKVKVLEIDKQGRINLSRKALL